MKRKVICLDILMEKEKRSFVILFSPFFATAFASLTKVVAPVAAVLLLFRYCAPLSDYKPATANIAGVIISCSRKLFVRIFFIT